MLAVLLAALESDEDKQKFTEIYELYHVQMEQTAIRILKDQHDAEAASEYPPALFRRQSEHQQVNCSLRQQCRQEQDTSSAATTPEQTEAEHSITPPQVQEWATGTAPPTQRSMQSGLRKPIP